MDFGTSRYFELNGEWYYAGNDGAVPKGPQTIDGVRFTSIKNGTFKLRVFVKR